MNPDTQRINLAWLIRLRWGAVAGQLVTIAVVTLGTDVELMLAPLLAIVAIELASNVAFTLWAARASVVPEDAVAGLMAFDVLLLTGLLYFSGGPSNPFNFLYLVHIALAAVVLHAGRSWALVGLSLACSGLLFVNHLSLGVDHGHHAGIMRLHLEGMWVAFVVSAAFIVYFVTRVRRALAEREEELDHLQDLAARREKLAALATLSAGAAHELATPLATIAVVARELERTLESQGGSDDAVEDARLIRDQVERCRAILDQMAADAGQATGESLERKTVADLVESAVADLPPDALRLDLPPAVAAREIDVYPRAVAQALRVVIDNAIDASSDGARVVITAGVVEGGLEIEVVDAGAGMSPEVLGRAGQPFFTTKEPGKGMGLGLFLARTIVERLGGTLSLDSSLGRGTRVAMVFPAS